jgi:hypothetical protein
VRAYLTLTNYPERVGLFTLLLSSPHGFAHRQIPIFSQMKRDHVPSPQRRLNMNPLKPEMMTPDERLAEIGQLLALGFLRRRNRMAATPPRHGRATGDVSLDLPAEGSGHGATQNARRETP